MNIRGFPRIPVCLVTLACLIFLAMLPACQASTPAGADQPPAPTIPQSPTALPPESAEGGIALNSGGSTLSVQAEVIPAVPPSAGQMWTETLPEHRVVALRGYPDSQNLFEPAIFTFPVVELARYNEAAGHAAADLKALLESRRPGEKLPFLPPVNAVQVFHAHVQFVDFKNGTGVRYLTQFNQGPVIVNNTQLVYTFQGLTADGKWYVAAILPVTHPELEDEARVFSADPAEMAEFPNYAAETVAWLEGQAVESFNPNLVSLDALVQSIEVK
jgi:hypothetical protein